LEHLPDLERYAGSTPRSRTVTGDGAGAICYSSPPTHLPSCSIAIPVDHEKALGGLSHAVSVVWRPCRAIGASSVSPQGRPGSRPRRISTTSSGTLVDAAEPIAGERPQCPRRSDEDSLCAKNSTLSQSYPKWHHARARSTLREHPLILRANTSCFQSPELPTTRRRNTRMTCGHHTEVKPSSYPQCYSSSPNNNGTFSPLRPIIIRFGMRRVPNPGSPRVSS
jgi:hypothetical protein